MLVFYSRIDLREDSHNWTSCEISISIILPMWKFDVEKLHWSKVNLGNQLTVGNQLTTYNEPVGVLRFENISVMWQTMIDMGKNCQSCL